MQGTTEQRLRVGIVAGEASGDLLGATLMRDILQRHPNTTFVGIGGPQMLALGLECLYDMEQLAVMGVVEVLSRLPSLFAMRDGLIAAWRDKPIDVFVGVDAPDFNLRVAKAVKEQLAYLGTKTVQYVSPSVWAWRQERVHGIKAAEDLVLCLFPFEVDFYQQYEVPAAFVGHPLAQTMPLNHNVDNAKQALNIDFDQTVIALLPGSRSGEINRLLPPLLGATAQLLRLKPGLKFIIPAINTKRLAQIETMLKHAPYVVQQSVSVLSAAQYGSEVGRKVLAACDVALLASGTAALEALFLARPMVVIYKVNWLTYWLAKALVRINMLCLPNILAHKKIVTELIQGEISPLAICDEAMILLDQPEFALQQQQQLGAIHAELKGASAVSAADMVLSLVLKPV